MKYKDLKELVEMIDDDFYESAVEDLEVNFREDDYESSKLIEIKLTDDKYSKMITYNILVKNKEI